MNISGDKVIVNKSAEEMYHFFADVGNFESIMPDDIQKFEVDGESFLFALKGMPEIRLVLEDKTEFSNVTLGAASSKLDFQLAANIDEIDAHTSEVQLDFNGKFNMMMAMMVKKPLTSFIEILTENLEKL
ncbi:MAG: orotate phosphoribosyltransferase [Flavobacteriaceae bacterium]|nr:orotate phosphoribosyltransferase [Flavobacteriaceae bacterium]